MEFKSYELLRDFAKILDDNGVGNLKLNASKDEYHSYYEFYDQFKEQFSACLVNELSMLFSMSIAVIRNKFYLNDIDAQGAPSHIDFKLSLSADNYSFELKVECIIFINRIILSFDTPELIKFKLGKQTMQVLRRFNKFDNYHHIAELRSLSL